MIDNKYIDIINLPYHKSKRHPHMSMIDRAAQFGAFAALSGYDEEIKETGRITCKRKDLNEEQKILLDNELKIIKNKLYIKPKIKCTYFIKDEYKEGGKYVTVIGNVIKIDENNKTLILENKTIIPLSEIIEIVIIENNR